MTGIWKTSQSKTCSAIGPTYPPKYRAIDSFQFQGNLNRHDSSYMGVKATHPDTAQSVTRNIRISQISAPIRSKFMYSNLIYTVAAYLVEKMSGLSFADFLQAHFCKPIGMSSTHLQPEAAEAAGLGDRIATPCVWNEDNSTYKRVELQHCPEAQGAGSIITSVNDYTKWGYQLVRVLRRSVL